MVSWKISLWAKRAPNKPQNGNIAHKYNYYLFAAHKINSGASYSCSVTKNKDL